MPSLLVQVMGRERDIKHFDDEWGPFRHVLPIWQYIREANMGTAHWSTLTPGHWGDTVGSMRRAPKHPAPEGFIKLLWEGMEKGKISLNQLAERAGMSPAFLSRILNKQRGLPSDKTILRLAQELDLAPPERLLIAAGRIPEEMKRPLSRPQIPALLRATGNLSETDLQEVIKSVEALALRQRLGRKRT